MADLSPRQEHEVSMAIKHLGRAMKAIHRADLPALSESQHREALYHLHRGMTLLQKASDAMIEGMMNHHGYAPDEP